MQEEHIVMILLKSLLASYKYLITTLEMMSMKELIMENVTARLVHKISKCKKKEPQGKDAVMISH